MYKKLLPFLFLLLSGKVLALNFPIEITEYFDDVKIIAYVNKSDINDKSQWTPFESPPPLSIPDALKAVETYISSDTSYVDTTLTEIELKRIPHHETYWHYLVKIKSTVDDAVQPHFFVVLMDGKVISAIKLPEAIK